MTERMRSYTSTPTMIYSYSVPSGSYDGAGNLKSYTDSVMGAWNFNYDALNRLITATPSSGNYLGYNGCWSVSVRPGPVDEVFYGVRV
jgi:YD repeat-containing protein